MAKAPKLGIKTRIKVIGTDIYGLITEIKDDVVTFVSEHDGALFERHVDHVETAPAQDAPGT